MQKVRCALCILALCSVAAFGQEVQPTPARDLAAEAGERVALAVSSVDYPVTPGDVYRLTYFQSANTPVTNELFVDSTGTIDLGIFGRIEANGKLFTDLRRQVEALIAKSYNRSLPSLRIVTPGSFRVSVSGEVNQVHYLTAWGLTKLSDIVNAARSEYSSLRVVEVRSSLGQSTRYDLLGSGGRGLPALDPYVRPGETITLYPTRRTIELTGEVRHPGKYELLPHEGLRELVEFFGGGVTGNADTGRIRIHQIVDHQVRAVYVSLLAAYESAQPLKDGDSVMVPSRTERRAVVWFEGALAPERMQPATQAAQGGRTVSTPPAPVTTRFAHPIGEGELLSDAFFEIRDAILANADLTAVTIYRTDATTPIHIDLTPLMSEARPQFDFTLRPNDVIFIPAIRTTVSVSGAVIAPGFFPYQPGFSALSYVNLAGGIDPERNGSGSYWVADSQGRHRKTSEPVMPGDRVYVPLDAAGYQFERTLPILATIITAILNTVTLVLILTR